MSRHWILPPETVFAASPIIPVLVIKDLSQALPLASALLEGGMRVLEITLRTPIALEAIALLVKTFPDALIGAGTIRNAAQLKQVACAGAKFAISPGHTQSLLKAGMEQTIPWIPGIATVSELMEGLDAGYTHFKVFPAVAAGGVGLLKALSGPFPEIRFCPTGGINQSNAADFLALSNVSCVGGSWMVPDEVVRFEQWYQVTELSRAALSLA